MKFIVPYVFLSLVFASCSEEQPGSTPTFNAQEAEKPPEGTPGSFYHRYSGTAGGRNIILNLVQYANGRVRGAYYNTLSDKQPIQLIAAPDTATSNNYYFMEEANAPFTWHLAINQQKLTGTYANRDGQALQVNLKEDYSGNSFMLDAWYRQDTGRLFWNSSTPKATAAYGILWPTAAWDSERSAFTRSRITVALAFEGADGVASGLRTRAYRYFAGYRNDLRNIVDSTWPDVKLNDIAYHYSATLYHYVVYNDNQWLVLEDASSNYTGGAHASYSSSFHNLDLKSRREWQLRDIVRDTASLKPYLELAARDYFKIASTENLSSRLLTPTIPITNNCYCTPAGITLVYNPYELAAYSEGPVALFVPFRQINHLLTEDFKQRMIPSSPNGVAMNTSQKKLLTYAQQAL